MGYEHRYKLLWKMEPRPEGVTKENIPKGFGASDAMLIASIIYPPDGSLSIHFFGEDGRTGETLDDREWFKVWSLLSKRLAVSKTLSKEKRELAELVFDTIASAVTAPPRRGEPS